MKAQRGGMKILHIFTPEKQALFWQIVRYGLTGLFVTACQATIYWTLAAPVGLHPQVANGIGYLAAVADGYVTHSSFPFRGHGGAGNQARRGVRFGAESGKAAG